MTLNEKLVAIVINACKFDPVNLNNISGFSFVIGDNEFSPGRPPYLPVNPRGNEKELERTMALAQEMTVF